MTKNSIEYTVNQIFKIANPKGNLKFIIYFDEGKNEIIINFNESDKKIIFKLSYAEDWYDLTGKNINEIKFINDPKNKYKIPVLFWRNKGLPFIEKIIDNEIIFNGDIISSSFFMLSRWEEKVIKERDVHGRFIYENSAAYKYNFIDMPIVDEYAMVLRSYLQILFADLDLGKNKFHIKLSHDIDDIRRFNNIKNTFRTLGGDILKGKSVSLFRRSLKEWGKSYKNIEKDPYFLGIYELAKISKQYNMDSAFYFKTSAKSSYDTGYIINDSVKRCIYNLQDQGFEIGFHAGYYTFQNYERLKEEKEILDEVLCFKYYGGRQHYLRFDVDTTLKYWERVGFKYDSTLSYAEHEGFRCGTCHPFKPFDIDEDRELNLIEIPLIAMDGTLKVYRKLTPDEGLKSIIYLMNKCKEAEGVFTLLWHNTSIYRGWENWMDEVYIKSLNYNQELFII